MRTYAELSHIRVLSCFDGIALLEAQSGGFRTLLRYDLAARAFLPGEERLPGNAAALFPLDENRRILIRKQPLADAPGWTICEEPLEGMDLSSLLGGVKHTAVLISEDGSEEPFPSYGGASVRGVCCCEGDALLHYAPRGKRTGFLVRLHAGVRSLLRIPGALSVAYAAIFLGGVLLVCTQSQPREGTLFYLLSPQGRLSLLAQCASPLQAPAQTETPPATFSLSPDGHMLWFVLAEDNGFSLHTVDAEGNLRRRGEGRGSCTGLAAYRDGALYTRADDLDGEAMFDLSGRLFSCGSGQGFFRVDAPGGSCLYCPPSGPKSAAAPVLFFLSPGQATFAAAECHEAMRRFAEKGYIACLIQPASPFSPAAPEAACADTLALMRGFASSFQSQTARVGVVSAGLGGALFVLLAAANPRYFSAAVLYAPVSDYLSFAHTSADGQRLMRRYFAGEPAAEERMLAMSPLTKAATIRTPTLMLHGEADGRTQLCQSLCLLSALLLHETPAQVRLLRGEGEPFSPSTSPAQRQHASALALEWFARYLPGRKTI